MLDLRKELLVRKKRVDKAQKDFNEQCKNLNELFQNEGSLNQSKDTLQNFLDSRVKQKQDFIRVLNVRKKDYFKVRTAKVCLKDDYSKKWCGIIPSLQSLTSVKLSLNKNFTT